MEKSHSYIAIPPGATIKEQIVDRGMSQKEFAIRMGMSEKHISKLINGEVQLTMDVARKLELVLGLPTQFWCNLENIYREKIAKVKEENTMEADMVLAKKFPYKEMAKNGWVKDTSKEIEKVENLRKYFEVVQLSFLQEKLIPAEIMYRKYSETEKGYYSLVAWSQKAKLEGRKINTQPINIKSLIQIMLEIRKMTIMSPDEFCPRLQEMLINCGVAVVFLPRLGHSCFDYVTFYDGNKIILGLTVKGMDVDKFWCGLFHELSHIVLGHIGNFKVPSQEDEDAADAYSENVLIPTTDFTLFINSDNINESTIIEFAKKEEIHAGIVLGRLLKYGYVESGCYKNLEKQYTMNHQN